MSCRIDYGKKTDRRKNTFCISAGILCILLGLLLQQANIERTGPALEDLARELQSGAPVGETAEAFLKEVFCDPG